MRRSHVTLRGVCADSQVALVARGTSEIAPATQATTSALEMLRYVVITVVRCKFIFFSINLFHREITERNAPIGNL